MFGKIRESATWKAIHDFFVLKEIIALSATAVYFVWIRLFRQVPPEKAVLYSIVVFASILGVIHFSVWIYERRVMKIELIPSSGPSDKMVLGVTNNGNKNKFHAQCEIVKRVNPKNLPHHKIYSLAWEGEASRELEIPKGAHRNLVIARADKDYQARVEKIDLVEFLGGKESRYDGDQWDTTLTKAPTPEYELRVSIFGDGYANPVIKCFTLRAGIRSAILMFEKKCPSN
ncbi:MAG: hypothetical protein ACYDD2_03070 [Candidatus Acidiferrales bacterium]